MKCNKAVKKKKRTQQIYTGFGDVSTKLLTIIINYLNFLTVKFLAGVKDDVKKINLCNSLERLEAVRVGCNASHYSYILL